MRMERFYKIAKIIIVAFVIAFLMSVVYYGMNSTEVEEIKLPLFLGIYFLVSAILFVICIIIGTVLEFKENIAHDRTYPIRYGIMTVACWLVIIVVDYHDNWENIDWFGSWISAVGIGGIINTMIYIFKKKTHGKKKKVKES